jgi:hypothetical protein
MGSSSSGLTKYRLASVVYECFHSLPCGWWMIYIIGVGRINGGPIPMII